jgi:hypothetical protein
MPGTRSSCPWRQTSPVREVTCPVGHEKGRTGGGASRGPRERCLATATRAAENQGQRQGQHQRTANSEQLRYRDGHGYRPRQRPRPSVTATVTDFNAAECLVLRLAALRWRVAFVVLVRNRPPSGVSTACLVAVAHFSGTRFPRVPPLENVPKQPRSVCGTFSRTARPPLRPYPFSISRVREPGTAERESTNLHPESDRRMPGTRSSCPWRQTSPVREVTCPVGHEKGRTGGRRVSGPAGAVPGDRRSLVGPTFRATLSAAPGIRHARCGEPHSVAGIQFAVAAPAAGIQLLSGDSVRDRHRDRWPCPVSVTVSGPGLFAAADTAAAPVPVAIYSSAFRDPRPKIRVLTARAQTAGTAGLVA